MDTLYYDCYLAMSSMSLKVVTVSAESEKLPLTDANVAVIHRWHELALHTCMNEKL